MRANNARETVVSWLADGRAGSAQLPSLLADAACADSAGPHPPRRRVLWI
jgi:hypothetical protein